VNWTDGVLVGTPWLLPSLAAVIQGRPKPDLRDWAVLPVDRLPTVSVILPARNEEANLERCLRSLLAAEYPHFEVVVVDDRSEDATPAILARIAAEDSRVVPVAGAPLPGEWYGKPWACWQGYKVATGDLLLFTDADTAHGPEVLARAVSALVTESADMLTLMPRQEMPGFWERVIQPVLILVIGVRFGTMERLNRNRDPRRALANGQFILTTRGAYERVGGHERVRHTVIEDMLLARAYVGDGLRIRFALADRDIRTRMYASLRQAVDGWTKNIFVGLLESFGSRGKAYAAATAALLLPILFLLPVAAVVAGIILGRPPLLAFGVTGFLGCSLLIGYVLYLAGESARWGVVHPLGAVLFTWVLLRATARGTRRIEWKGRTYGDP
jgi:chlorobactene glucosyltransferase